ncbi:hypothetical protein EBZ70_06810 [bacterium]|nr:hypothetical protein [bacterium]
MAGSLRFLFFSCVVSVRKQHGFMMRFDAIQRTTYVLVYASRVAYISAGSGTTERRYSDPSITSRPMAINNQYFALPYYKMVIALVFAIRDDVTVWI